MSAQTITHGTAPGRGTVQILVSRIVLLVSGFIVSIILARGLGPADFGIYGVVMSMLVWLERAISAGVPGATATLLLRGTDDRGKVQQSARALLALLALPLFGIVWVCAPTLSDYLAIDSGATLIRIAALNLPAMAVYFAYDSVFNGQRMFAAQSILQIAQSGAKLVGVLILLWYGLSVTGAFVAQVAATLAAVLVVPLGFRFSPGRPSWATMREMVHIAIPMGTYLVALSVLMSLSLWQLQAATEQPAEQVGYFVAGINLTRIMMMVPAAVSGVLFASLGWAIATSQRDLVKKYVEEAVRFAVIVTAPACVVLSIDASAILELLYGPEYAAGGLILGGLCVAFTLIALIDVLFHALMANGRFALSAGVLVALVPVLYTLNAILIPRYGAVGAAAASVLTLLIGVAAAAGLTWKHLSAPIGLGMLARIGIACLIVGVACSLIHTVGLWLLVKLCSLAILYLALLWVMRVVSPQDLRPFAFWKSGKS